MDLFIEVEDRRAQRMLHDIHDRLNSADRLLSVLVDDIEEYERDVFATQGHGEWAPDDPATVALKGHGRVLFDTGGLLDDLTSSSSISTRGEELTLQASKPYAGYLKRGARGAPPRDPVPVPDGSEVHDWAQTMLGFIVEGHR